MPSPSMPFQPMPKRVKNFSEVFLGFSKKQATEEAMRCPQPTNPEHVHKCPLGVDVHGFIRLIREGNINGAFEEIRKENPLAAVCGRVCPAPCEADVFDGEQWTVPIRALERFAVDVAVKKDFKKPALAHKVHQVAVVGSGPAGLTAAAQLAKQGYAVTVFEALHEAGGVLRYGIPEFRLPRKILNDEINFIKSLGVSIRTDVFVGRTFDVKEFFDKGYSAVFLAVGAAVAQFPGIAGERLKGVLLAGEFLMRVNLMHAHIFPTYATPLPIGKRMAVIGGGNDALDAARICVRLGREAVLVHEGTEDDLTAKKEDVALAKEEGVLFEVFARPLRIVPDSQGCVKDLQCLRMDFADPTSSGRWKLAEVEGSEFNVSVDSVILAGCYAPNGLLGKFTPDLKIKKDGTVFTRPKSFGTSLPGVFAAQGGRSLIEAMSLAKSAAAEINKYLSTQTVRK